MSLFKKDKDGEEQKPQKTDRNKIWVIALYLMQKINFIVIWITIIMNGVFIIIMFMDFTIGVLMFLLNQYIVISYYLKIRKEKKERFGV